MSGIVCAICDEVILDRKSAIKVTSQRGLFFQKCAFLCDNCNKIFEKWLDGDKDVFHK